MIDDHRMWIVQKVIPCCVNSEFGCSDVLLLAEDVANSVVRINLARGDQQERRDDKKGEAADQKTVNGTSLRCRATGGRPVQKGADDIYHEQDKENRAGIENGDKSL